MTTPHKWSFFLTAFSFYSTMIFRHFSLMSLAYAHPLLVKHEVQLLVVWWPHKGKTGSGRPVSFVSVDKSELNTFITRTSLFFLNVYFETDNELSSRLTSSVCWRWFSLFSHHFCRWPLIVHSSCAAQFSKSEFSHLLHLTIEPTMGVVASFYILFRLDFSSLEIDIFLLIARIPCQSPTPKECNIERPSSSQQLSSLQSESHLFGWRRREEVVKQLGL